MEQVLHFLDYLWSFFVVISVIVFIHEFGHYFVAKLCGVKIEAFSIGFGKELVGWQDRSGTRWKISLLPLGGYVKMFGDASEASTADKDLLENMSPEDKARTFHFKPLWQKALVVVAGPAANFVLTIAVFTYFIMTIGLSSTAPIVGSIMPDTPAAASKLKVGDNITAVDGKPVKRFADIPMIIATNLGKPVMLTVDRDHTVMEIKLTPKTVNDEDGFGNKFDRPIIGIKSPEIKYENVGLVRALGESVERTYDICVTTLRVLGQMITGQRSANELKGPIGIAKLSGQATAHGFDKVIWLIAMLSANLGLVNLLPIPVLDGGHLAYYAIEGVRGRPLAEKFQEYSYRVGFALIIALMAFTIFNDVKQLLIG